jgi:2-dehydro-3-deoxy-D-arabinonate dehydratase
MALCRYVTYPKPGVSRKQWGWVKDGLVYPLSGLNVALCLGAYNRETHPRLPYSVPTLAVLGERVRKQPAVFSFADIAGRPEGTGQPGLLAPIGSRSEVWAAGVTYESSKLARMAESPEGGDFYARVYTAGRPELFFKATPNRVVGPNDAVRIRADSAWNVPEPELAVLIAANGRILGYTIGNDMSSRDIEGANPLYLPQAKVYRGSCALGPVIVPAERLDPHNLALRMTISRNGAQAFAGETSTSRIRRTVEELRDWLFRENDFPRGVFLLTGTGLIPSDSFSLLPGDEIAIEIAGIGTLRNTVA